MTDSRKLNAHWPAGHAPPEVDPGSGPDRKADLGAHHAASTSPDKLETVSADAVVTVGEIIGMGGKAMRKWREIVALLTRDRMLRASLLVAAVFILAYGALALTRMTGRPASVWLANAVIVAIALRAPRREWAFLLSVAFLANFGANILNQDTVLSAAVLAGFNIVESALVIHLLGRGFTSTARFDDRDLVARFLLYAGVVGPGVAALGAASFLALNDGLNFATTLFNWYIADALGLLSLGSLLLAAPFILRGNSRRAWLEGFVSTLLAGGVTALAFGQNNAPMLFTVAPVLLIATLRAPFGSALTALAGSAAIAIATTMAGEGPIARAEIPPAMQVYLLQAFIAALLCAVLPVRALIGERDRLGGVLAQSERLFSRAAEASMSGMIHFDPVGRPTFVNSRWTKMTGMEEGSLSDHRWLEAIDPIDRGAAGGLWARARMTQEPSTGEFRFLCDGAPAGFAELNLYPEVDNGKMVGFVARLTDVTSRRMTEDALQEREERYRLVTENAQDVILSLGLDGRPIFVSGAALRVTGYAPVELVGRSLGDLIHPDDAAIFDQTMSRLAEGHADASIEFRLRHRDGHYSWFESSQRPLFDQSGMPMELIVSLHNIDLRRQSESIAATAAAKLRETNRLLLLAEELAGVGHWHFGPSDGEIDYSPQINRILQRSRADRLRVSDVLAILHPADRRPLMACLARARSGTGGVECALRVQAAGDWRHLRMVAQAEHRGKEFSAWVGVVRDVTDQVTTQAALIQARDEAQAAALAKSHFLATMSHEIRTPMTGVLGMIELLRDTHTPSERKRFFATLRQSADLLMAVLDDVLDFSKIESGALKLEKTDFDLESLAMATLDLFGNAASRKGLLISFESRCTIPPLVQGDPVRLQQILSNLLSNAIKFTERGRITLILSAAPAAGGSRFQFQVVDTGIGLEPHQIETLFDPFIQADVSTSRRYGGTGLGLAISRRLVEAMGGKLNVRSRAGRGSTFTFDVTLAPGAPLDAVDEHETFSGDGRALEVLIAEDNPVNQMLIAAIVRRMGHHVTIVENGREAVDAAAGKRFDAVLMDMQMPELDGLAATRAIRASDGPSAATPIIALTADASPERRRFYDGAGLSGFMTKPIDRKALAAWLAMIEPALDPGAIPLSPTDGPPSLFDPRRVEELRTALGNLRFNGLLSLLVTECRERPQRLRTQLGQGDLAAIRAEAHSLKGAAVSIGAVALGHAARQLEAAPTLPSAAPLIEALSSAADETRVAADEMLSHLSGDRAIA